MKQISIFTTPEMRRAVNWLLKDGLTVENIQKGDQVRVSMTIGGFSMYDVYRIGVHAVEEPNDRWRYTAGLQLSAVYFIGDIRQDVKDYNKGRIRDSNSPGFIYDFERLFTEHNFSCDSIVNPKYIPIFNPTKDEAEMLMMLYPERFR